MNYKIWSSQESAVFPFADCKVKRKSFFGISAVIDMDTVLLLFFLFTCIFQYSCKRFLWIKTGRGLFGLAAFLIRGNPLKRRYHRNRLNFIKLFISVCFDYPSLDQCYISFILYIVIFRLFFRFKHKYLTFIFWIQDKINQKNWLKSLLENIKKVW